MSRKTECTRRSARARGPAIPGGWRLLAARSAKEIGFVVEGIYTTIPLHRRIFEDPEFRDGNFDTKFMERFFEREKARREQIAG